MLVFRHPGLFLQVHPTDRKFFYHFDMENIALILVYLT